MAKTQGDHSVRGNLAVGGDSNFEGNGKFVKGLDSPYLEVIDQKTSGTAGGTFTGSNAQEAAWRTRDITNVVFNDFATSVTTTSTPGDGLANIVLEEGIYYCEISAPAFNVNEHVARLADVTDNPGAQGATVVLGTTEFAADTAIWQDSTGDGDPDSGVGAMVIASSGQTRSHIRGKFTLNSQRTLEIQHRCTNTQSTDGFGSDGAFYETNNVFTVGQFWMIRDRA